MNELTDYAGEYDDVDIAACERILGKLEVTPPEEGDDFWGDECDEGEEGICNMGEDYEERWRCDED